MVDRIGGVVSRVELSRKSVKRSRILYKVGDVKDGLGVGDAIALKVVIETTAWSPKQMKGEIITVYNNTHYLSYH